MSSTSTLINRGDDPLSSVLAGDTTPPSTTPHLPKLEDVAARASRDYARDAYHPSLSGHEREHEHEDLEALHPTRSTLHSTGPSKRQYPDPEESGAGSFQAPTGWEKVMMGGSIGVVLLVSVAAGLTTVCDWVL
ncbi:hypothetical protein NliqN6_0223 [Naganishia liquefaciens]|uniref:Uncharacterized protein n=1 Tax=Naganishia liquefaciens TaxID=104408 RepID=A0A8H3TMH0_9TREE|nr:hypothetical protein NliqN6_0223 [Naganishia liquefaciens]